MVTTGHIIVAQALTGLAALLAIGVACSRQPASSRGGSSRATTKWTQRVPERQFYNFQASETYFWEASWRNNFFNVLIREGGFNGRQIYEKGKSFSGRPYDPDPHVIYVGAPVGRSGTSGASVDHVTVRQVWVSSRPRLASINK